MGGKVCLNCKGKILLGVVNKLLKTKGLFTSLSPQQFQFLLKVMGLNPGYLLKYFLLQWRSHKDRRVYLRYRDNVEFHQAQCRHIICHILQRRIRQPRIRQRRNYLKFKKGLLTKSRVNSNAFRIWIFLIFHEKHNANIQFAN